MRRLVGTLLVLCALAFAADRGALIMAKRELATEIQAKTQVRQRPGISLRGFPFLTQAFRGRYEGGQVTLHDLRTDRLRVQSLVVDLRDVRLPLSDLLSGAVFAVPVGQLTGTARINYSELAAATGIPHLRLRTRAGRLEIVLPVTRLGQTILIVATGRIAVSGHALRITAGQVQGLPVPQALVDFALAQLRNRLSLEHLPYGLALTGVAVRDTGIEVQVQARNVVLSRPPQSG